MKMVPCREQQARGVDDLRWVCTVQAAAVARGKGEYPERLGQPECQVLQGSR